MYVYSQGLTFPNYRVGKVNACKTTSLGFIDNTLRDVGLWRSPADRIHNMLAKLKVLMMKALELPAAVWDVSTSALLEVQKTNLDN